MTGRMLFLTNECDRWQRCFAITYAEGRVSTLANWLRIACPRSFGR